MLPYSRLGQQALGQVIGYLGNTGDRRATSAL